MDRGGVEFGKDKIGKLSYMEVLKRGALKRYGVSQVDGFKTQFTPQRISRRSLPQSSNSASNGATPKIGSNLFNVSSPSQLHKETLIDDPVSSSTSDPKDQKQTTETSQKSKDEVKSTEEAVKALSVSDDTKESEAKEELDAKVPQPENTSEEAKNKEDESQEIPL